MICKINILHLKINKRDYYQTKPPFFGVIGLILSDVYTSYASACGTVKTALKVFLVIP